MESRYRIVMDFPSKEIAENFVAWWEDIGSENYHITRVEIKELSSLEDSYDPKKETISFEEEEDE